MTKSGGEEAETGERAPQCGWCHRALAPRSGPGRPRRYCGQSCRQQAYLARKLAMADGQREGHILVERGAFETAQDRIELLRQALGDLDRERGGGGHDDPAHALAWLHAHAAEVAAVRLEPTPVARSHPDAT